MNEMDVDRSDYCDYIETAAADTTSDSSLLESPVIQTPTNASDHYRWVQHSSGRMLPVGIAHPLKVDDMKGTVAADEDDSEPEDKGTGSKDSARQDRHSSGYKGDQNSDDNDERNASSSADMADSSSSSSDSENTCSQVVLSETIPKETFKKEYEGHASHVMANVGVKSPLKGTHSSSHQPVDISTTLPTGKEWHLFVSHSTSDKDLAKQAVLVPLREKHRLQVKACYHCMPDPGCYDDNRICKDMNRSCVVMIGLSPAYLGSQRCVKEQKLILDLHQRGICTIVVGSFAAVSRPSELKNFTYLDYVDHTKQGHVLNKLLQLIDESVNKRQPSGKLISSHSPERCVRHHVEVHTPLKADPLGLESDQPFKGRLHTGGHVETTRHWPVAYTEQENVKAEYEEENDKRLEEEFEAEFDDYPLEGNNEASAFRQHLPENEPLETTSSGESDNESSSDSDSGDDGTPTDYNLAITTTEELSRRERKISFEESEEVSCITRAQEEPSRKEKKRSHYEEVEGECIITTLEELSRKRTKKYHETVEDECVNTASELSRMVRKRRNHDEVEEGEVNDDSELVQQRLGNAAQVTSFYNTLAEPNLESRSKSPIFHMRNFNNWVKSVLIRMHLRILPNATVLDLCCGKGGDLLKWKEGGICYLVGADIAATSIEQCSNRFQGDKMKRKSGDKFFDAEFHVADCTQVRLRDLYSNPAMRFNIASCQFSLHYCFESQPQAEVMLQNLCENLRPSGYFIGTTVDSNELLRRFRESHKDNHMCGNSIYSAVPSFDLDNVPLFGAKYDFHLEGVVDVPEYLIHFPQLRRMLEDHNMELVFKESFQNFFYTREKWVEDMDLLYRMQALSRETGTLSGEEWDAIGLYLVFAFRKCQY